MRFGAHGGRGDGLGLIATEESVARLVHSRLTFRSLGGECGLVSVGGCEEVRRSQGLSPGAACRRQVKAKMAGGGGDV